jgi:hypothetical protein
LFKRMENLDVVLHIGDQVYPDDEDIQNADSIFNEIFDGLDRDKQRSMMLRGREMWRNKYRKVFSRSGKQEVLANTSNLMVWSDNDVANDFTTMKTAEGQQKYHPQFLVCGMRVYREYQRRLWDPLCSTAPPAGTFTAEWHSHVYGPVGIFMMDLRGNRIDHAGHQMSERPLISDEQWTDLETFFARPELRVIILCSETPFLGDEPTVCQEKVAADPVNMAFLRDHWPFNEAELLRLLDLCFSWKVAGQHIRREVLLLGGDIHCGVTSVVRDEHTGLQIDHLTASPVTNHVCKFFPPNEGRISPRYSFSHLPLGRNVRNYADVSVDVSQTDVFVNAKLVPVPTDIFKEDAAWRQAESEWYDVDDF